MTGGRWTLGDCLGVIVIGVLGAAFLWCMLAGGGALLIMLRP